VGVPAARWPCHCRQLYSIRHASPEKQRRKLTRHCSAETPRQRARPDTLRGRRCAPLAHALTAGAGTVLGKPVARRAPVGRRQHPATGFRHVMAIASAAEGRWVVVWASWLQAGANANPSARACAHRRDRGAGWPPLGRAARPRAAEPVGVAAFASAGASPAARLGNVRSAARRLRAPQRDLAGQPALPRFRTSGMAGTSASSRLPHACSPQAKEKWRRVRGGVTARPDASARLATDEADVTPCSWRRDGGVT
jgi:hypothetical protein